jgi:hypothetical protein
MQALLPSPTIRLTHGLHAERSRLPSILVPRSALVTG